MRVLQASPGSSESSSAADERLRERAPSALRYPGPVKVKGTAYLARLKLLQEKLGDQGAADFVSRYRVGHPEFPEKVLPTTRLPIEMFLAFTDAIVGQVYDGDVGSLWEVGERSAEWSLQAGPYKNLLDLGEVERFVKRAPVIWSNFFDEGSARADMQDGTVELWIEHLPPGLSHPYLEFSVVGYFRRGIELLGGRVEVERVAGFAAGDDYVHYRLRVTEAPGG